MIILGIDQGIANFGFAVIDINDDCVNVLDLGLIKTPAKHTMGKRLTTLKLKVEDLVKEYQPSYIGCEKLFYNAPTGGRNKSLGMMHVNMATGMLHMISNENNISMGEYPPTTVKKMITGNGRATKEDLSNSIEQYLSKKACEHEIDAIAIGITTYYKSKEESCVEEDKGTVKKKRKSTKGAKKT